MSDLAAENEAIRQIEARFNDAWNRHDPDGMVESLTDDGQFVTVNGVWMTNRGEFLKLMQKLHGNGGPFRTSHRETLEMHVRMLGPDAAMVHSRFRVSGDVEVIGMLPDGLQKLTVHAAGVTAVAKEPDAAHALIRHLVTPAALAIYKARGLGL